MTPEREARHAPQPPSARDVAPPHGKDAPAAPFREINERRARVENTELLRHLRGL